MIDIFQAYPDDNKIRLKEDDKELGYLTHKSADYLVYIEEMNIYADLNPYSEEYKKDYVALFKSFVNYCFNHNYFYIRTKDIKMFEILSINNYVVKEDNSFQITLNKLVNYCN